MLGSGYCCECYNKKRKREDNNKSQQKEAQIEVNCYSKKIKTIQ
jgi:hypothetical protein